MNSIVSLNPHVMSSVYKYYLFFMIQNRSLY